MSATTSNTAVGRHKKTCNQCQHYKCTNKCGRCSEVYYCNDVCQRNDWLTHRPTCHQHVADRLFPILVKAAQRYNLTEGVPVPLCFYCRLRILGVNSRISSGWCYPAGSRTGIRVRNTWISVEGKVYDVNAAVMYCGAEIAHLHDHTKDADDMFCEVFIRDKLHPRADVAQACKDVLSVLIQKEAVMALFASGAC